MQPYNLDKPEVTSFSIVKANKAEASDFVKEERSVREDRHKTPNFANVNSKFDLVSPDLHVVYDLVTSFLLFTLISSVQLVCNLIFGECVLEP